MFRPRALNLLAALGVATGLGVAPAGPAAAAPTLSEGCAFLHQLGDQTTVTGERVLITGHSYELGEQLRLLAVSSPVPDDTAQVEIAPPGGASRTVTGPIGQVLLADILQTGVHDVVLTVASGALGAWRIDCGIPPMPSIDTPADGQTYAVGEDVPTRFTCTEESNPVASCSDSSGQSDGSGSLDTTVAGAHTYTVTGTDTRGLKRTTTISYAVVKSPQTLSFTSTPPSGADWFFGDFHGSVGYVAQAVSTSGLPVAYSVDPSSAEICRIAGVFQENPIHGSGAAILFDAAGTCTINADQAGDDAYLPAERSSQSFVIERVPTWLSAARVSKGVLGLTPSTFTATLSVPYEAGGPGWGLEGLPGQPIDFSVAGKRVCTATTDADGAATCTATVGIVNALLQSSYTATYGGSADYLGAAAQGKLG